MFQRFLDPGTGTAAFCPAPRKSESVLPASGIGAAPAGAVIKNPGPRGAIVGKPGKRHPGSVFFLNENLDFIAGIASFIVFVHSVQVRGRSFGTDGSDAMPGFS